MESQTCEILCLTVDICILFYTFVIRLAKEKVSYEEEANKQQQKIETLKADGDDEYVIKKQVRHCAG